MTKVIAVTEPIGRAGTILMWTLQGETNLEVLREAWLARGLDEKLLPSAPSEASALRRAVQEHRQGSMRVAHGGRWHLTSVRSDADGKPEFEVRATAYLDQVGRLQFEGDEQLGNAIRAAFEQHQTRLQTEDFSVWLTRLVPKLDGVPLRGGGGVYFVPHDQLERLDAIVQVLRAATAHTIYRIPAMAGDDAVQAILDAVEAEATAEAESMEADLQTDMGERAYENRIAKCDAVEGKVARYEGLLGAKLDALRARLETLRANLTVAMVRLDQKVNEKVAAQ